MDAWIWPDCSFKTKQDDLKVLNIDSMLPFQHFYLNIQKFQGPVGRGQHDENLLEYDCTVLGAGGGKAPSPSSRLAQTLGTNGMVRKTD
jgi:hypothetical protein